MVSGQSCSRPLAMFLITRTRILRCTARAERLQPWAAILAPCPQSACGLALMPKAGDLACPRENGAPHGCRLGDTRFPPRLRRLSAVIPSPRAVSAMAPAVMGPAVILPGVSRRQRFGRRGPRCPTPILSLDRVMPALCCRSVNCRRFLLEVTLPWNPGLGCWSAPAR